MITTACNAGDEGSLEDGGEQREQKESTENHNCLSRGPQSTFT